MFVRNTEWTRKLFRVICDDKRFGEGTTFNTILPPFIDRFQLALSIYYDQIPAIKEKISIGPVQKFACLPDGEGKEYDRLRKIMRKIVSHDYSEFVKGQYTTTVWCLSTGVKIDDITTITENNLKHVVR
jgi:hypothetical protein